MINLHPVSKLNKSIKDVSGEYCNYDGEIVESYSELTKLLEDYKNSKNIIINGGYESNHYYDWLCRYYCNNKLNVNLAVLTDPISVALECREIPYSLTRALTSLSSLLSKVKIKGDNTKIIKLDASLIYDSGGDVATEICYILSLANQYITLLRDKGHLVNDIFNSFCILINSDEKSLYKIELFLECWKKLEYFWGINTDTNPLIILKIVKDRMKSEFNNEREIIDCRTISKLIKNNIYININGQQLKCTCEYNHSGLDQKRLNVNNIFNQFLSWEEKGGLLNIIRNDFLANKVKSTRNRNIKDVLNQDLQVTQKAISNVVLKDVGFEYFYNKLTTLISEKNEFIYPEEDIYEYLNTNIYRRLSRFSFFHSFDEFTLDYYTKVREKYNVAIIYDEKDPLSHHQSLILSRVQKLCQIDIKICSINSVDLKGFNYIFVCSGNKEVDSLIDNILELNVQAPIYLYGRIDDHEVFGKIAKYFTGYISDDAEIEELVAVLRLIFNIY
jgi:hypothetical protein